MGVTSAGLEKLNIIDQTIPEPMGGAHRDIETMSQTLKEHLFSQLTELQSQPIDDVLIKRYDRLMSYGNPA